MQKATSPWIWTLLVSTLAAVLVAGAGVALSRRVERLAEKPPGNRVDDAAKPPAASTCWRACGKPRWKPKRSGCWMPGPATWSRWC